ncbi:Pentapeptide_repeats-containing protein [Hexamita inflata]|uniref:Pentapeptide repeats-containing protein n=1 Tax=Hexamita inflata TaxID=28002 RepID=A0AA86NQN8_9EUKA|nr:Pentapeptide repeats-containing protein [Hexamita inflata]
MLLNPRILNQSVLNDLMKILKYLTKFHSKPVQCHTLFQELLSENQIYSKNQYIVKDEWLKEILEIQKQINNSVIHQNGLEFELDCMRACINVLSIGKHDIKDEILNTISKIIQASISAIKADFSGLINLAKKQFDLILLNGGDKIKEFWYLKVMAISYTYGLSATNQEMLDKVVKLVNDSMKGNWHVCYAGLHSISKAFDKNTLNLGEALKVIEKFSTFKYLCNSWRLREKVTLICIQQSTNSRYKDEFAKILRNMNRTETKSEVLKTLQNPEYLLSIREFWYLYQAT